MTPSPMPAHKRLTVLGRMERELRATKDCLRLAERALREGRTWASYQADVGVTVDGDER